MEKNLISEDNCTKISVCINSFNSEATIENTLKSVEKAYEIIVCDMHSDDNTVEIARKYGAKILYHERKNYAEPARNYCISEATGDWILVVDTDEVVPEELWQKLKEFTFNTEGYTTLSFPISDYVFGKPLRCMYRSCVKRFWKKGCATYSPVIHGMVHTLSGKDFKISPKFKNRALQHFHVNSFEQYIEKINRYTSLEQSKFQQKSITFSIFALIFRPIFEFFKIYIGKQGFKDGTTGFIMAIMHSFYQFSRLAKLYETELKSKTKQPQELQK